MDQPRTGREPGHEPAHKPAHEPGREPGHEAPRRFWCSRYAIGFAVIGSAAAYFLLTEHLAHVIGALPYLLLLACPLMHVFMHGGHGGHGGHRHGHGPDQSDSNGKTAARKPGDSA